MNLSNCETTVVGLKSPGRERQVGSWTDDSRRGGYGLTGSTGLVRS